MCGLAKAIEGRTRSGDPSLQRKPDVSQEEGFPAQQIALGWAWRPLIHGGVHRTVEAEFLIQCQRAVVQIEDLGAIRFAADIHLHRYLDEPTADTSCAKVRDLLVGIQELFVQCSQGAADWAGLET